jgi:hypothetical protein
MDRLLGLISTNTSIRSSFGTNNGQFSNIDFLLDERPAYKTNILLSCFLKETLQQILRWVSQDCDSEIS